MYNEMKHDLPLFVRLHGRIKKERLSRSQISELLKMPNLLLDLKKNVDLYNDHIWNLHSKKLKIGKEIEEKRKSLLAL